MNDTMIKLNNNTEVKGTVLLKQLSKTNVHIKGLNKILFLIYLTNNCSGTLMLYH